MIIHKQKDTEREESDLTKDNYDDYLERIATDRLQKVDLKLMDSSFLKKLWCCVGGRDEKKIWFYQTS